MSSKGKKKGKELIVLPEQPEQCQILLEAFQWGAQRNKANDQMVKQSSRDATEEQKKRPITKRSGINRMSVAISNAPAYMTGSSVSESSKQHKNPKNIVSGIGYGGYAFVKGIASGIGGIFYEPYKGAKKKGAKGAAVGVGKGLIGLVAKPVAGTVGLVGCTVQGAVSTPGTIKRAVTKKGGKKGEQDGDSSDEEHKTDGAPTEQMVESVAEDSETNFDDISMRTESIANMGGSVALNDIEEYNREKAEMNEKLQSIKQLAESGDPTF
mmetsp:Transcript_15116/g.19116  ORF Transcript_15116/g.19116 Transcript_15116/m.19116 type:complete len:268 (+) Transcript_15116:374-1177(+)